MKKKILKLNKKNDTEIKDIFFTSSLRFGNRLVILNNLIDYCELLGIKNIYLNESNVCFKAGKSASFFFLFQEYIKPQIKLNLISNEIKKNLPEIKINKNELFIHIFEPGYESSYPQPPLCFYQKVINKFKFTKIYIIAENKNNPVISKLLEEFPNIIYQENNISLDISYLINAYNLVASVSTFLSTIIILNDNISI